MKCTVPCNLLYSSAICSPCNGAEHSESMLAQQWEFLKQFKEAPQTAWQPHIAHRAGCQNPSDSSGSGYSGEIHLQGAQSSVSFQPLSEF